ncbi:hypothetical protein J120_00690 [candidate division TM6 bacterium JCVI TM6SC1]|uniref:tRNA N6-adenosine threonylcarbamoyltransferase n=1 Tax=candidate division TM6 bacterium JCVI TM6SC1 TaxID=1306947 RepID=A0A0D2I2Q0_9BACT|nr:hypothetical protein J120_00690 [candidate division TM6 bacterium JCVI TM6SC1]
MKNYTILAIESSCDEAAAAVYTTEKGILSSVLYSQTEEHTRYGGVVPEVASRTHLRTINSVVQRALEEAQVELSDINCIGVTNKPGLAGSLLIGLCFAKSIAWAQNIPIIGVNHLEGHAFSSCIEHPVPFPHLCLTASGGHTSLYLVEDYGVWTTLGTTHDDAAGEAFDKIARFINLPYPGGPVIETLAQKAGFVDYFGYPRTKLDGFNFSFSGLKTAVLYDLVKQGAYDMSTKRFIDQHNTQLQEQVSSSLLVCIGDIFSSTIERALKLYPQVKALTFVGGVACNKYLRSRFETVAHKNSLPLYIPSAKYCTDNAAMIGYVAHYKAQQDKFDSYDLDIHI